MATYNGARKKTNAGTRNAKSQLSETSGKSRNYIQNDGGGGSWSNTGSRRTRSNSEDGWGDVGRRASGYRSDDLWGPLPGQTAVTENAWERKGSSKNQKSYADKGKKSVPLVGANFSWDDEYPALDRRAPPVENVWEKRKEKLEGLKAMEPTNMTEEELMIQKAIELSKREAREEEERRRQIREEYELQNQMLSENPEFFSDFLTPDEIPKSDNSFEPPAAGYQLNDFKSAYGERQSIWDCPEPAENQWNQKKSQKLTNKKKRNKSQTNSYTEDEISNQNTWPDSGKWDHDKHKKTVLPEQNYQDTQDNWSENPVDENYCNEAKEYDSQFVDENSGYSSAEVPATTSQDPENKSKLRKGSQPKISKVIDMFGGWGPKNTQNSSLNPSYQQESVKSFDDFSSNSATNNEEIYQDNWGQAEEISKQDENSSKHREVDNFSKDGKDQSSLNKDDSWNYNYASSDTNYNNESKHSMYSHAEGSIASSTSEKDQPTINEEDSWNSYYSSSIKYDNELKHSLYSHAENNIAASTSEKEQPTLNDEDSWNSNYSSSHTKNDNELKHSLYSHVESNISASASSSFCTAATDPGTSYMTKKSVAKDDDMMNSIVQDYASLAVKCTDASAKENVPIPSKSKDIFSTATTLLNEDIPKPDVSDFSHSSIGMPQNLSMTLPNQTFKNEISYSLNNNAPEASNIVPNENIAGSWNDSTVGFPTNPEGNEINNSLFLPPTNEPVKDAFNDHGEYLGDSAIPAPIQREIPIPCQPNPVMGNFMDPNLMMGLNPLMMQQMMMLNNPFFLQQLRQMQMYYTAMSMPFNTPLITPVPLSPFNPMLNNTVGNIFNGEPPSNMNPVPEQSVESSPTIPPPFCNFENEIERSVPSKSDASKTPSVSNVEFENSWLSDLLTEGAAHMDSFIPPPTMPVTEPSEHALPAPNVDKVDLNIAQDRLQYGHQNETISQNFNCDTKSLKSERSTMKYGTTEDVNANTRSVNSFNTPKSSVGNVVGSSGWSNIDEPKMNSKSSVADVEASGWGDIDDEPKKNSKSSVVESSGWGDIDDVPKKNYSSWNDDVDGWADTSVTSSKSTMNSSRYAPRKQTTSRQPTRQPRQTSQW